MPEMHIWPVKHGCSQPPQFLGSVETSEQPDWHVTRPGSHTQLPFWQVAPGLQGPLFPQAHAPLTHVPPAQSVPQLPQF